MLFDSELWNIIPAIFNGISPEDWRHAYNIKQYWNPFGLSGSIQRYEGLVYRTAHRIDTHPFWCSGAFLEGGPGGSDRILLCSAPIPEQPVFSLRNRTDYDAVVAALKADRAFEILPGRTEAAEDCFLPVLHVRSQTHFVLKWCLPEKEVFTTLWQPRK